MLRDKKTFRSIAKDLKNEGYKKTKSKFTYLDPDKMQFGVSPDTNYISLAHELGHAKTVRNPIAKNIINKGADLSRLMDRNKITHGIAGAGIGAHSVIKKRHPEMAKKIRAATLVGTSLPALSFLNEGVASLNAARTLKNKGKLDKGALKQLGSSLGTYAPATLPFLASGGYFLYDKLRRERNANESDIGGKS